MRLKIPEAEQPELLHYLCDQGILVKLAADIYFHVRAIAEAQEKLTHLMNIEGFSLAEARDALSSSRKYTLPLLEYFDKKRVTRRIGEKRILL